MPNGTIGIGSVANSGTLIYTGAGETTDRVINLAGTTGTATIQNDGTGALNFSSNITVTGVGAKSFNLQGSNTGANIFAGVISDSSSGATALGKQGAGTWSLSGANTYGGGTFILGGVLSVAAIADTGTSNLGQASGATAQAANYLALSSGTLQYTGAGAASTSRYLWMDVGTGTFDITQATGSLTLSPTGGTVNHNLTKTSAGTLTMNGVIAGTATVNANGGTLILGGANSYSGTSTIASGATLQIGTAGTTGTLGTVGVTDNGTLTFNRTDSVTVANVIGGTGGVTQAGSGTTILSALSTYSGATAINAGTLQLNTNSGSGAGQLAGTPTITVNNGGTLALNSADVLGYTAGKEALIINSGGTVTNITTAGRVTIQNVVTMTGGVLTGTGIGDVGGQYSFNNGAAGVVATSDASGNPAVISAIVGPQAGGDTLFNVTRGAATPVSDLNVTGNIISFGGGVGIAKSGTGIMTLTGTNTYPGATTISGGTLRIGNGGTTGTSRRAETHWRTRSISVTTCRTRARVSSSSSRASAASRPSTLTSRRVATPSAAAARSQAARRAAYWPSTSACSARVSTTRRARPAASRSTGTCSTSPGTAVEEDRVAGGRAQRRGLVHAPGRGAGHLVLGALAQGRRSGPPGVVGQQAEVEQVGEGGDEAALQRRRAREPGAHRHVAGHGDLDARHLDAVLAQGPHDTGEVCRPARRCAGRDVRNGHLHHPTGSPGRGGPEPAVVREPHRGIRALREGDREGETAVVVGVLTDEVDPSWSRPHPGGTPHETLGERVGSGVGGHRTSLPQCHPCPSRPDHPT